MQEARLKLEAIIAVTEEEILALRKRISEFEQRRAEANDDMLKWGCIGTFHENALGIVRDIDGQQVSVINGYPTISTESSPFYLMKVSDYREHMIPAFRKQRQLIEAEQLEKLQAEARLNGWEVPMCTFQ